jgi:hypothetical protein
VVEAFRGVAGNKPVVLQAALSWASTEDEALDEAMHQWSHGAVGGEVAWDLRRPQDFDLLGKSVTEEQIRQSIKVSADTGALRDWIAELAALEVEEIHLHNVGRNQGQFIETFGAAVLPRPG